MKLHLTTAGDQQLFSGHGEGYVAINKQRYRTSVLVTPASVVEWAIDSFSALSAGSFEPVLELKPDILILGTGRMMRFPPREATAAISAAGIGLEVMDSGAACRTYNVLATEGRRVAAAILVE